jgi:hypothetical protein
VADPLTYISLRLMVGDIGGESRMWFAVVPASAVGVHRYTVSLRLGLLRVRQTGSLPLDAAWPNISTDAMTGPVVVKESWPSQDGAMLETEMFKATQGGHGIPDVFGAVNYSDILNQFADLKNLEPCNDFPEVPTEEGGKLTPERRALVRMIFSPGGRNLGHIVDKPKSLVKAIIDAMIGTFL